MKRQTLVAYFAARDPRTPPLARWLGLLVAAYAFSPIDRIPDFIPVLGYLDDVILVPLGLALVLRMIPDEVKRSAREKAETLAEVPASRAVAAAIVAIWLLAAGAIGLLAWRWWRA